MQLTVQTDYALRTLMFLATAPQRSTAADVAALFDISVHHVAKVVHQLARMGYIRSMRGARGGIRLARDPAEIRLGAVIEAFEGNMHLLECVGADNVCVIESFCRLKGVRAEAERVQREYLYGKTLADVMPTRRQLHRVG
jgi:Rrf2 family nitric oxide-sensitive transcriptional repressor